MLNQFTAYLAAIGTALGLLTIAWKAARRLLQFVEAVTANTSAVASLGNDLRQHTIATTQSLAALDQRVTKLESPS